MFNDLLKNLNRLKRIFNVILFIISASIFIYKFVKNPNPNNEIFQSKKKQYNNNQLHKRNVSQKTKKIIASNQQWKCNICKKLLDFTFEVDHVNELRYGGNNDINNLQALCPNCHRRKTYL
tara:strand:- start:938 stop:1300 length:363 start_codon:yes stop_codon:yes gene_type:complete